MIKPDSLLRQHGAVNQSVNRPFRFKYEYESILAMMDEMIKQVDGKRGGLWKENWDRQKDLFVWPQSSFFTGFVSLDRQALDGLHFLCSMLQRLGLPR